MISSKAAFGIAAGVCGTLILGYCIYFDKQRHNDPEFKKKLRESKLHLHQIYILPPSLQNKNLFLTFFPIFLSVISIFHIKLCDTFTPNLPIHQFWFRTYSILPKY